MKTNQFNVQALLFPAVFTTFALLAFTPLRILTLVGIILVGAALLRVKLDYFYKVLIFFTLLFAFNSLLGGLFFVFGMPFMVTPVLIAYLVILAYLQTKKPIQYRRLTFNAGFSNITKLLLSAVAFTLLLLPVLSQKDYAAYPIFSFSSDNISHIELLKAVDNERGYFYKPFDESKDVITEGLSGYPQGLHINMYLLREAIAPVFSLSTNYSLVVFVYGFSAAMFIIFAWMFFLATKGFIKTSFRASLPGIVALSFLFTGVFFGLFALGSQSQVASMALFLLMLAFFNYSHQTQKTDEKHFYTCAALVLLGSIAFTWLILLPVAGLIALFYLYVMYLKPYGLNIKKYPVPLVWGIAIGLTALTQIYVQLNFSSPKSNGINEPGFSITPSLYLITILVIVSLLLLLAFRRQLKQWIAPLVIAAGFSSLVYLFQMITVGEARYYLYKSLYVVIALSSIAICLAVGKFIENNTKNISKGNVTLIVISGFSIATLSAMYNIESPKNYIMQRDGGGFSREIAVTAISRINDNPTEGKEIIIVGSCNRANDYIATRFVGALSGNNNSTRQALLSSQLLPKKESLLSAIEKYQRKDSPHLVIISSDYQIQSYLQKNLEGGVGTEEYIDIDFGHVPKSVAACPNAVR